VFRNEGFNYWDDVGGVGMTDHEFPSEDGQLSRAISRRKLLGLAAAGLAAGPAAALLSGFDSPTFGAARGGPDVLAGPIKVSGAGSVSDQIGAISSAFDPMDPAVSSNGATINLFFYCYEALYRAELSNPTTFVPQLAAGPPMKINSLTWKVKLRPGAKFQNGLPVTAKDVVFSFNRLVKFGPNSFLGKYVVNFKSMQASAPDEVTIHLRGPMDALLIARLAVIKVLSQAAVAKSKNALLYQPVGSGPYRVTSANPGVQCTLEKFPAYNGPMRNNFLAKKIQLPVVSDLNAELAGLESGRFNAIAQPPLTALASLKASSTFEVAIPSGHAIYGFLFNAGKAPFDDYRVRQAVMYGIDRNAIVTAAFDGAASVANALVPSANADYTKPSTIYTYNPSKAKSLLKAAGYGGGLSFTLFAGTNIAGIVQACEIMQQQLAQIGVTVTIQQGDNQSLYAFVLAKNYEAFLAPSTPGILGSADAEFIYRWLYYGAFPTQYLFWTGPTQVLVQQLLDKAVTAQSYPAYKSIMARVIEIVAAQGPFVPVVLADNPVAWNTKTCAEITPSHLGNLYLGRNL